MKAKWYGLTLQKVQMLMDVFQEHNERMNALIDRNSIRSPVNYETSYRHTQEFMRWKYKIDDINIKKLNYEFISNYEFWLKSRS